MATIRIYSGTVGGTGDGTSWANAYTTLLAALAAEPDGTDYILHWQHVENNTTAATVSWDFSTTLASYDTCISVDKDNSDAYRKGAVVDHNINAQSSNVTGFVFSAGVTFENGNGGSSFATDTNICSNAGDEQVYADCVFRMDNTGSSGVLVFGDADTKCTLYNCEAKFLGSSHIQLYECNFRWYGGTFTSEGTAPSQLFVPVVGPSTVYVEGVDFSSSGTAVDITGVSSGSFMPIHLRGCKLASSWAGDLVNGTIESASEVILENSGNNDINHGYQSETRAGQTIHQLDLYAAGSTGAKHNTVDVPLSYKLVSNANTDPYFLPLFSAPVPLFNENTTSQTIKWEFIHNDAAALQDDDVWIMLSYPGTSATQQVTFKDSSFDDKFGTYDPYATPANIATSTKAWDEGLTARANSTAYSVGQIRKVASNAGRAFICTASTGNSAASEPAGFATAVDGDSVTDGDVTWKAMRRQKCELTLTAAEQGAISAQIILAKASTTIWTANRIESS